ncbi:MAG: dimethyl sulfoxide reductase anchor subunit [Rhodobacteraceae bacterium]|nr:dimethyl sulfoxide reductase anchor subunit [Paracoccaceae bacterium]
MHPAKSVILFTTASGAGYGLLIWLALFSATGTIAPDRGFGFAAFVLSLGLVTGGLLSSTLHLGHPERAWRAMSQWRTSWLSREGVAALLTYAPALLFAAAWVLFGTNSGIAAFLGLIAAAMALVTIYCTAMIYASLRTVHAWHNIWTRIGYMTYGLMTGAALMALTGSLWGVARLDSLLGAAIVTTALGYMVKWRYWRFIDGTSSASTAETATRLKGDVRLLEAPHTEANYLMTEMGFQIARDHSAKLRRATLVFCFAVPFVAFLLAYAAGPVLAAILTLLGTLSMAAGILVERWLFFAEAKHVVMLYYGEKTA